MPRYTLIRFDRYEVANSEVTYHDTPHTSIEEAFKEVLVKVWGEGVDFKEEWKEMKVGKDLYFPKIGIDFEEESYLFFIS
jgi:hypothetical protein